jgi:hypothetical protein
MIIELKELQAIEDAAFLRGVNATMNEVVLQLPALLDAASKANASKAQPSKRGTRPAYPNARRSSSKPTLRPVN